MGKRCVVSFTDPDGLRHEAEVTADSVYEAAVLAVCAFKKAQWTEGPAPGTRLCVEVLSPVVRHEVTLGQVKEWLDQGGTNPNDQARKRELKALLTG